MQMDELHSICLFIKQIFLLIQISLHVRSGVQSLASFLKPILLCLYLLLFPANLLPQKGVRLFISASCFHLPVIGKDYVKNIDHIRSV